MRAQTKFAEVVAAKLAELAALETLSALLGGAHVYARMTVERIEQIPGVYWYQAGDTWGTSGWESSRIRWDIWARSLDDVIAIENVLRDALHMEVPETVAGYVTLLQVAGTEDFGSTKRTNISRRVLETQLDIFKHRPQ